jgi:hypothetical protein
VEATGCRRRRSFAYAKEILMDGTRFDSLTRCLAQPLPRRRLLQRVAAGLAGVLLAGRAVRVGAITCPAGRVECDGRCCDDGWQCIGPATDRLCTPPCEEGARCSAESRTCCVGICCLQNKLQGCCPAGSDCCRGAGASECCPATSDWHCVDVGDGSGNHICLFCPATHTRCGAANCCAPGFVCVEGPNPGDGACIPCPPGATKCGAKQCCPAGETCSEDGTCVAACPAGGAARRGVAAEAGCEPPPKPCRKGTVKCGDACVPPCKGNLVRSLKNCKCVKKCPPDTKECGDWCIDPKTLICCGDRGYAPLGAECCGKGFCNPGMPCCDNVCCKPDAQCCAGKTCCPEGRRCCGEACCPANQSCSRGRCCPFNTEACGDKCCGKGEVCNQRHEHCCPVSHPYFCPKVKKCAASKADCPK